MRTVALLLIATALGMTPLTVLATVQGVDRYLTRAVEYVLIVAPQPACPAAFSERWSWEPI